MLKLVIGVPASGKTHWINSCKEFADAVKLDIYNYQQMVREEFTDEEYISSHDTYRILFEANERIIKDIVEHINAGEDVIVEHTLYKMKRRLQIIDVVHKVSDTPIEIYEYVDFQVPVDYVYREDEYQTVFRHEHVSPANLEYARFRDNDSRKGFLEYLAQGILMEAGKGTGIRAPQRMEEVLQLVKDVWEQYPDFRLGQLLVNNCGKVDLFYVEDEDLVKALQRNKFPIEEN